MTRGRQRLEADYIHLRGDWQSAIQPAWWDRAIPAGIARCRRGPEHLPPRNAQRLSLLSRHRI